MGQKKLFPLILICIAVWMLEFFSVNVYAGKLYIKPDLERRRAARLLDEADSDFRNGKIHITLSPEIAYSEFKAAKDKYEQVIELIEAYGEGYYTPGDVDDFTSRAEECRMWMKKSSIQAQEEE